MLDAVRAMPDHLRDALWRIETARAATMEAPAAFVCGMGGSAIGGDLAVAALSRPPHQADARLLAGYELPSWAPAGSAVLCSSYSGNTEETLACYAAAEALGAQRLVATTGGELAELARADDVPVIGLPGGPPAPRRGRLHVLRRRRAGGARPGRRRGSTPRSTPPPPTSARPSRPRRTAPRELAAADRRRHPRDLRQRPDRPGRLSLEDARSTRTPRSPPSPACCPRPTTTSSRAGPGRRAGASPRSSSRTATSTRASGSASSSPPR